MKKLLLITIILLLQSYPSFGKWVEYNRSENKQITFYFSYENIKKIGSEVYFFQLLDHLIPQTVSSKIFMSSEQYITYNCKNKKIKFFYFKMFDQPMGKGNVVHTMSVNSEKQLEGFNNFDIFLCGGSEEYIKKGLKRMYDGKNK